MALTDYDKKNLSKEDQKRVQAATDKWNAANAKGDKAGMTAAANEAAAIRNNAGYKTDSSGNYSGGYSNGSNNYSPYAGGGYKIGSDAGKNIAQGMGIGQTYTASDGSLWRKENDGTITVNHGGQMYKNAYAPSDYSTLIRQQIAAGVPYQDVQNAILARENKALNDPNLSKYAYDDVYNMAWNYILDNQGIANQENAQENIQNWMDGFASENPQPTAPDRDPRIDQLLNEILNRDDFSYNAMNDPLYQQYAKMYQREGDRAMKETMAEAAAGAGGMNTYAMTAAMQANNYYNAQLNDKIPELYQLAYDMYLNDKESQVQDLGLLQAMDDTQYARYRDTMTDWYADKKFAYGAYQDAVNQGNWQTNFDYNSMLDNRNWGNDNYWANKEWNHDIGREQIEDSRYDDERDYERDKYAEETAYNKVVGLIGSGVSTFDPALIAQAGLNQTVVDEMVAEYKRLQALAASGGRSGGGGGGAGGGGGGGSYSSSDYTYSFDDDGDLSEDRDDGKEPEQIGSTPYTDYGKVSAECAKYAAEGDKFKAAALAKSALDEGYITQNEYNTLLAKYNPMLDIALGGALGLN
jgi:hypothetical protein